MVRYDAAHAATAIKVAGMLKGKLPYILPPGIADLRPTVLQTMRTAMRLSALDLACRRGGRDVFSGVGFSLAAGEVLAVTGRNGAGKSSLLRIVAGLIRPASGRLWLDGGDPELTLAEQAHYLGHQDPVKPALSVLENLQFWSAFFGSGPGKVQDALAAVGLAGIAALPAAYLSAGQRRRLSIARLLAIKRPVWLLDEPASTLDAAAQARLAEFMQTHLAEGGLIVAATHDALGLNGARELSLDQTNPSVLAGVDRQAATAP
jgi:heme exporter protein A